jgi:hypothetical protein
LSVSGVGDHHNRIGVGEQLRQALGLQERAHGHDDRADLGDRPVERQQLEAIGQDRRDLVALADAGGQEPVGQAIDAPVECRVAQPLGLEHDGGMRRPVCGVPKYEGPDIHPIRSGKL